MRRLPTLVVLGLIVVACTGAESTDSSTSTSSTTEAGIPETAPEDISLTCWTSQTAGEPGPITLDESTEELGLIDPLTGLHAHASAFGDTDGDNEPDMLIGTFGDRPPENYQVRGATGPAPDQLLMSTAGLSSSDLLGDELGRTSGGLIADLDGDGDDDLVLIRHAGISRQSVIPSRIYENEGGGQFLASEFLPVDFLGRTPAIADFDGDGLLDLYVSEDKFGDRGGLLLRNSGGLEFEDVTAGSGLEGVFALGATAADLNGDSRPDLVTSRNIFVNQGGMMFTDVTPPGFVAEPQGNEDDPAGVAIGDLNRDGIPDLVLGQHNRLTVETDATAPIRLFVGTGADSDGHPQFEEVLSADSGLTPLPTLAPHVHIADMDNDGWPDIITSASASDGTEPAIFRSLGSGELAFEAPTGLGSDQYWVGSPIVDFNRDGRLDVFALEWEPSIPSLMFLGAGESGHWLEVSVDGSNRGVGALVTATDSDGSLIGTQEIGVGGGYASGHMPVAHFGLGAETTVDVTIEMSDGELATLEGVEADQHIRWPNGCG